MLNHLLIQPLFVEHQGDLVNAIHILSGNDLFRSDVAEQGNLFFNLASDLFFGPAYEDVRLDTDFPEGLHAVLCGFCFHFARGLDKRKQGKMDVEHVLRPQIGPQLAYGLKEGKAFDISDSASHLDNGHIDPISQVPNLVLNLVGNVRDHLNCCTEIFSSSFLLYDRVVNLAGCKVVLLPEQGMGEPLIMAKVQVGLRAVIGHEHFAVLERVHGPGINVDVRVHLQEGHSKAPTFHQRAYTGRGQSFPQGGKDATCYEYEFGALVHDPLQIYSRI